MLNNEIMSPVTADPSCSCQGTGVFRSGDEIETCPCAEPREVARRQARVASRVAAVLADCPPDSLF